MPVPRLAIRKSSPRASTGAPLDDFARVSVSTPAAMPSPYHRHHLAAPWLRVIAVVCAGLVFTLSSAAWSPALHAWLHGEKADNAHAHAACANSHAHSHPHSHADAPSFPDDDHAANSHAEHDCAITLFANGVTLASAFLCLLHHHALAPTATPFAPDRVTPPSPGHLRPQPQAPPIG